MNSEIYDRLAMYLAKSGIGAQSFSCTHRHDCRRDVESRGGCFTEAADTQIGCLYGSVRPRFVHISLDPGTGECLKERVLSPEGTAHFKAPWLRHTGHWYWLLRVVGPMMRAAGIHVHDDTAHAYIAHTSAARCAANLERGRQGPPSLVGRCKEYLREELEILDPDIVVSMGKSAHESLESTHRFRRVDSDDLRTLTINDREIVWIALPHPSRFGAFHGLRKAREDRYRQVASNWRDAI